MIIQNELKLPGNKNLFKWTIINKDILDTIKEIKKQDLKDVLSKMLFIDNMYTLKFVDFNIYNFSDLFDIPCKKEKEIHYEFQNCILTKEIFEIIEKNNITSLMITHNMQDAITYGNRLIMLHAGEVIFDIKGEEKKKLTVEKLLEMFKTKDAKLSDKNIF